MNSEKYLIKENDTGGSILCGHRHLLDNIRSGTRCGGGKRDGQFGGRDSSRCTIRLRAIDPSRLQFLKK